MTQSKLSGAEQITAFLIGSRLPPDDTKALHEQIRAAVQAKRPNAEVDALLAQCETDECATCGAICCPHQEPLHFHHDGCPCCDGGYYGPEE